MNKILITGGGGYVGCYLSDYLIKNGYEVSVLDLFIYGEDVYEEKNKIKKLCSWHFIWSKYYFYRKNYGNFLSICFFLPIILRSSLKIVISYVLKNQNNQEKYRIRIDGLISSILGKKSYKRIEHF